MVCGVVNKMGGGTDAPFQLSAAQGPIITGTSHLFQVTLSPNFY